MLRLGIVVTQTEPTPDDGEQQIALQFVPDEQVGFLAPRIRSSNIEDLPYEVLEKNLQNHFDVITRSICW